jgi:hypothetical protein
MQRLAESQRGRQSASIAQRLPRPWRGPARKRRPAMCPCSRSSSTPSTGAPLRAGRCRSSGCAQVPSPRSRHLLPPTIFHAPRPRQRASRRPTNGGRCSSDRASTREHYDLPSSTRSSRGTLRSASLLEALTPRPGMSRGCGRAASPSRRQWLRSRARPAADGRPPGVAGPVSNVLKHANDLIRYIDKCFAVVSRSADACHSRVLLPAAAALSLRRVDRLAVGGA